MVLADHLQDDFDPQALTLNVDEYVILSLQLWRDEFVEDIALDDLEHAQSSHLRVGS